MHQVAAALRIVFLLALVLAFPLADRRPIGRLRRFTSSKARIALYRHAASTLWLLALTAVLLMWGQPVLWIARSAATLGWLMGHHWVEIAVAVLLAGFVVAALYPGAVCKFKPAMTRRFLKPARFLRFMLPVRADERRWFALLSLSAGLCEELIYRGFVLSLLAGRLPGGPHWGLTWAWVLSSLAFGTAHLYQGLSGCVRAGMAGFAMGLLALLTGGLLAPMLLHTLMDLQVLVFYRPDKDVPEEARMLIEGCSGGTEDLLAGSANVVSP